MHSYSLYKQFKHEIYVVKPLINVGQIRFSSHDPANDDDSLMKDKYLCSFAFLFTKIVIYISISRYEQSGRLRTVTPHTTSLFRKQRETEIVDMRSLECYEYYIFLGTERVIRV